MSKKKQHKASAGAASPRTAGRPGGTTSGSNTITVFALLAAMAVAGALFWPILKHGFTNWDDEFYIVNNALLRGPDWAGIFSQPVVSNYHPLTVATLAANYSLSELKPISYFFVNWALHVANTGLVFYLVWLLSGKREWVALFTAAVFAAHPMHVESVSWISERKDVLYAFFYLLALLRYWRYLENGKRFDYGLTLGFFVLSLLSKPAAVVFPLTLLLFDYWKDRPLTTRKVWLEKAPFFFLSLAMGVATMLIQSKKAVASLELYSFADRLFFGCYGLVTYIGRFFLPSPLAAFHPYPLKGEWGMMLTIAPVLLLLTLAAAWYFRKNKALTFGLLFYLINIILVVQFIAIGNTILGERYTYMPYIGLSFALAMLVAEKVPGQYAGVAKSGLIIAATIGFGILSSRYIPTWASTESLWTNVIRQYPRAWVPRSNRANFYYHEAEKPANAARYTALIEKAVADCDTALMNNPGHYASLDIRSLANIRLGRTEAAIPDADNIIKIEPNNPKGYVIRATANQRLKRYDEALADFNRALELSPNDADALNGRGTTLFNGKRMYRDALSDFEKALEIDPNKAETWLNRSRCYLMLGDKAKARESAEKAQIMGFPVKQDYWDLLK